MNDGSNATRGTPAMVGADKSFPPYSVLRTELRIVRMKLHNTRRSWRAGTADAVVA